MARYAQRADVRTLLARKGLTLAEAERRSGLAQGSLSRLLAGRRGRGLQLDTVRRLARGVGIPLEVLADGFEFGFAAAQERHRRELDLELLLGG